MPTRAAARVDLGRGVGSTGEAKAQNIGKGVSQDLTRLSRDAPEENVPGSFHFCLVGGNGAHVSMRKASILLAVLPRRASGLRSYGGIAGPRAKQSLGQNFLQDTAIAQRIVDSLADSSAGERVVELGPGQGALTTKLFARYPMMTAVEIDQRMIKHLQGTLPGLAVQHDDLLRVDFAALSARCGGPLEIVSNVPFYLTSKLLFKLIGSLDHVGTAVFTMQREAADRLLAPHDCKQYGILSVMMQLFGAPEACHRPSNAPT